MALQQLLGDLPSAKFVNEYYLKLPFALAQGCQDFVPLGSWDTLESILRQPNVDMLVVRGGERWPEERVPDFAQARALFDDGYTLVVRNAERHHAGVAELARSFERDFRGAVDVHLYCTPANQFGFGWHYDAEDVFILQTAGSKQYSLRKNTVHPWPLVETIPADMRYEQEIMPLVQCSLHAGDWLYIPAGYWHKAESTSDAISLAVGVMSTAAIELFDFLRARLLESLRWRQRLPTPGEVSPLQASELQDQYQQLCRELGADLAREMSDGAFAEQFLASKRG